MALLLPARASAQEATLDVRVGFGGAVRVGASIPVKVEVSSLPNGGPAAIEIDAPGLGPEMGLVVDTTTVPFQAVPGALQSFDVPVLLLSIRRPLVVRVLVSGHEVARRDVAIPPSLVGGRVVVALSNQHAGMDTLTSLEERVVPVYAGADALPPRWQEYAPVDLLVIRDLDSERVSNEQRDALVTWVRLGGRLVVIARPGVPPPSFLDRVLPADPVETRTLAVSPTQAGAGWPPGSYTVTALAPRPGAAVLRIGTTPVIARAAVGSGWIEEWGVDPWQAPLVGWSGTLGLWSEALGPAPRAPVDVDGVADLLPFGTPIGPGVHGLVGAAVFCYLAVLYLIARRRVPFRGAAASLGVVAVALAGFWVLASDVRVRSTSIAEATFLEPAPGTGLARALTVGAVSVPYGGGYRIRSGPDAVIGALATSGNVRATVGDGGTTLDGRLPTGKATRAFQSLAVARLAASATMDARGRLVADVGPERVRRAEVRWGTRAYWLGDLPSGATVRTLDPAGWVAVTDISANEPARAWIFQASTGDAIIEASTPVLIGEVPHTVPVFDLVDGGTVDQRPTILLLRVVRR